MEFDPLRDEGILYALNLMAAGVSVELHSFPGTFHGSAIMTGAAVTRREAAERMTVWRRALGLEPA
jgi:acetyl esterase/lipase